MKKLSKRHAANKKLVDPEKVYALPEAVDVLLKCGQTKFDQTINISMRLGINPKKADQQLRGTMVLPHGTGKVKKILVIAKGEKIKEASDAGADYVGFEDMIAKIQGGWLDFDVVIATTDVMRDLGKVGKILGTKGLMPNPKAGTVTQNVSQAVSEVKAGRVEYRVNDEGLINLGIGKISFGKDKIVDNVQYVVDTILKAKPATAKGHYMKSIALSSTMGPGMRLDLAQFAAK